MNQLVYRQRRVQLALLMTLVETRWIFLFILDDSQYTRLQACSVIITGAFHCHDRRLLSCARLSLLGTISNYNDFTPRKISYKGGIEWVKLFVLGTGAQHPSIIKIAKSVGCKVLWETLQCKTEPWKLEAERSYKMRITYEINKKKKKTRKKLRIKKEKKGKEKHWRRKGQENSELAKLRPANWIEGVTSKWPAFRVPRLNYISAIGHFRVVWTSIWKRG